VWIAIGRNHPCLSPGLRHAARNQGAREAPPASRIDRHPHTDNDAGRSTNLDLNRAASRVSHDLCSTIQSNSAVASCRAVGSVSLSSGCQNGGSRRKPKVTFSNKEEPATALQPAGIIVWRLPASAHRPLPPSLVVDGATVWGLGQSFNKLAERAHTSLVRMDAETAGLKECRSSSFQ
jgi:hypothetical protein